MKKGKNCSFQSKSSTFGFKHALTHLLNCCKKISHLTCPQDEMHKLIVAYGKDLIFNFNFLLSSTI